MFLVLLCTYTTVEVELLPNTGITPALSIVIAVAFTVGGVPPLPLVPPELPHPERLASPITPAITAATRVVLDDNIFCIVIHSHKSLNW